MAGQRIGYIRVSSGDQNPARQLDAITLDHVFTEYASGKDVQRPQLAALLTFVRAGDTVVIHSMDRLARNLDDLRQIVQDTFFTAGLAEYRTLTSCSSSTASVDFFFSAANSALSLRAIISVSFQSCCEYRLRSRSSAATRPSTR